MNQAIGQLLPFAVGVGLSPLPIIAIVLMLATPRARVNGPAFLLGWIAGLSLVGEREERLLGGIARGDHHPHDARRLQRRQQIPEGMHRLRARQLADRAGQRFVEVVYDHSVSVAREPLRHLPAHLPEPDHSQLHAVPPGVSAIE